MSAFLVMADPAVADDLVELRESLEAERESPLRGDAREFAEAVQQLATDGHPHEVDRSRPLPMPWGVAPEARPAPEQRPRVWRPWARHAVGEFPPHPDQHPRTQHHRRTPELELRMVA